MSAVTNAINVKAQIEHHQQLLTCCGNLIGENGSTFNLEIGLTHLVCAMALVGKVTGARYARAMLHFGNYEIAYEMVDGEVRKSENKSLNLQVKNSKNQTIWLPAQPSMEGVHRQMGIVELLLDTDVGEELAVNFLNLMCSTVEYYLTQAILKR